MSAERGWGDEELLESIPMDRRIVPFGEFPPVGVFGQAIPLAQWASKTKGARAMEVLLFPVRRNDGAGLFITTPRAIAPEPAGATLPGSFEVNNVVSGVGDKPGATTFSGTFLRIRWGAGGSPDNTIICDYPWVGGGIVLVANRIQVELVMHNVVRFAAGSEPAVAAQILPVSDAGGQHFAPLSLLQVVNALGVGASAGFSIPSFARECLVSTEGAQPLGMTATWKSASNATPILCVDNIQTAAPDYTPVYIRLHVPGQAVVMVLTNPAANPAQTFRINVRWLFQPWGG